MTDESGAVATEIDSGPLPEGSGDGARPMRADARRNYEGLIAAARLVFAQQGGGASMEAIAKEAGVGAGTLYRHFPTRIDLVEAVYREDVDKLVSDAEKFVAEQDPWDAVVSWLQAFVRYASSKRTFLSELHEAFEKNPELRVKSRERIESAIDIVLLPGQEAGVVRPDLDGSDLMQLISSMCMSATLTKEQSSRLLLVIQDGLRPPQ
jgi:AcrR family transcriptional regulator